VDDNVSGNRFFTRATVHARLTIIRDGARLMIEYAFLDYVSILLLTVLFRDTLQCLDVYSLQVVAL
jgi:hypothetical protein